ncbi:hypothetical protein [Roseivivax halodurans]|uniref:hypothetical protein n=1 Tax=Roseivivax halodurans TaxID=93683 RepID=UPI0004ACE766|nr:hypothetical protein [Roseivivax halodurans]
MGQDNSAIDHLVIVAGVSCTGKTTLLRQLKGRTPPLLPGPFADLDLPAFEMLNAMDAGGATPLPSNCLLHYDLFRPMTFYGALYFEADPVLDRLASARHRSVLTLWEDPGTLFARSLARRRYLWRKVLTPSSLIRFGTNLGSYRGAKARRERMHPWLSDPGGLWSHYTRWFEFLDAAGVEAHWCGRTSNGLADAVPVKAPPSEPFWSA